MKFDDILEAFAALEKRIDLPNMRIKGHTRRVDDKLVVKAISDYTGYKILVREMDLYPAEVTKSIGRARDLYSHVTIFQKPDGLVAEIVVNSHVLQVGDPLVNHCWSRFCIVKEACQVLLRHYFNDRQWDYPDSGRPEQIVTLLNNLVRFKFSIEDFDNSSYPLDTKVENAAEILAVLLLYPIEDMDKDRNERGLDDEEMAFSLDSNELAERYKVPERYVDLFLTSENFGEIYGKLINKRHGI